MFKLDDFFHLPQLDRWVEMVVHDDQPGLVIVAGVDPRAGVGSSNPDDFIASGRGMVYDILVNSYMAAHPAQEAIFVSQNHASPRPTRVRNKRVKRYRVDSPEAYTRMAIEAARGKSGLVTIDLLDAETAPAVLPSVQVESRVIAQVNTVCWGADVARQLADWGVSAKQLGALRWVVSVQRVPALCPHCRQSVESGSAWAKRLSAFPRRSGTDAVPDPVYYSRGSCERCKGSGRSGELMAFDIFQCAEQPSGVDTLRLDQPSCLTMEDYLFGLAGSGRLAVEDLFQFGTQQLRQTYNLLVASEKAQADVNVRLRSKLAELEAANQVLLKRTEVLFSVQDTVQLLTTTMNLTDLADKVCRKATTLCDADRAIFYYLRSPGKAEVLAVAGWNAGLVHRQFPADQVFDPHNQEEVAFPTKALPPGIQPEGSKMKSPPILQAGLGVPLNAQGQQVGLMIVQSTQKRSFTPGEVTLLKTFANQAALAIQRTGLIENLQAKIQQLEAAQVELVKKERLDEELALARQVQQSVLPRIFPELPGFRFAARNEPAHQVGGDFYDVIPLGTDRFGLVIADVSDKGMPAALYMALTRSLILAESRRSNSPREVLISVNRILMELGHSRQFVSIFYGVVDRQQRKFAYARAGHDQPLWLRQKTMTKLGGKGTVLGIMDDLGQYLSEESIDLEAGDRLVLYTDGLTDCVSSSGQFFGLERLIEFFQTHSALSPAELCTAAFAELAAHQGKVEQYDDMTLLVMEVE